MVVLCTLGYSGITKHSGANLFVLTIIRNLNTLSWGGGKCGVC